MSNATIDNNQVRRENKSRPANTGARLATLPQLLQNLIPAHLDPPPCKHTLRAWFDEARIPRFKSNPMARRGGGPVFYQVCAVEKLLKSRLLPGNISAPVAVEQERAA